MARQLASLLLAVTFLAGAETACPRGAWSCMVIKQANHGCCGQHESLRSRNCCGAKGQLSGAALTVASRDNGRVPTYTTSVLSHGSCASSRWPAAYARHFLPGSPCPPDTPITRHIALLL
jgi:hypothetical protein